MAGPVKQTVKPVRLTFDTQGTQVIVTPMDEDRFVLSMKEAVRACQAYQDSSEFALQFKELLLPRLHAWCEEHQRGLGRAYLTVREDGMFFLAVMKGEQYDAEFEDGLTELDLEIAGDRKLSLIRMEVMALPMVPDRSLRSFMDEEFTIEVWNGGSA